MLYLEHSEGRCSPSVIEPFEANRYGTGSVFGMDEYDGLNDTVYGLRIVNASADVWDPLWWGTCDAVTVQREGLSILERLVDAFTHPPCYPVEISSALQYLDGAERKVAKKWNWVWKR